jgi:hypothetical protein
VIAFGDSSDVYFEFVSVQMGEFVCESRLFNERWR